MLTLAGRTLLLDMALRGTTQTLYIGLCQAEYAEDLQLEDIEEPTLGVNGYARMAIPHDPLGWPEDGVVNNERFVSTDWLTWAATDTGFDVAIQRMFICTTDDEVTGDVIALGGALSSAIQINADTAEADRKFKFRIYAR